MPSGVADPASAASRDRRVAGSAVYAAADPALAVEALRDRARDAAGRAG